METREKKKAEKEKKSSSGFERRLLPVPASAAYIGIATQTLYNRIGKKSANPFPVKPIRIGNKPLFDIRDLDAFIEGQKVE